ncbi:MAG: superoxide dismutase family protein, partial [Caldimonas sp.]
VRGRVTGLTAGQEHGFHVHEKGDCSSGDGMSAGGHFNPNGKPHGPPHGEHHAGDLPSLKADATGTTTVRLRVAGTLLGGSAADLAGKALIVHAAPDDYTTQPTGNSGARIACGVIGTAAGRDASGAAIPLPRDL